MNSTGAAQESGTPRAAGTAPPVSAIPQSPAGSWLCVHVHDLMESDFQDRDFCSPVCPSVCWCAHRTSGKTPGRARAQLWEEAEAELKFLYFSWNPGIVWVGRTLKLICSSPVWAGTHPTVPGCSEFHPAWAWTLPGMDPLSEHWALTSRRAKYSEISLRTQALTSDTESLTLKSSIATMLPFPQS